MSQGDKWAADGCSARAGWRTSLGRSAATASLMGALTVAALAAPGGPQITQQPQSVAVISGQPASFSVVATGVSPLSYQWQVDGFNITNGGVFSGAQSATLNISTVTAPLGGPYAVTVTDGNSQFTLSDFATLSIAPPPADECASAAVISTGTTMFSTVEATTGSPDEPGACAEGGPAAYSNDVWFRFLAPCEGDVTVSLCGADFDAKLAVYVGCPSEAGTAIACNDDFCGTSPQVTFFNPQITLYRIRVGGANGAAGTATMVITCTPAPTCPADINDSGAVDIDDLLAVISAWGNTGKAGTVAGDVDANGTVDIDDLLAVIGAWGKC
jgi:hypothetical protein